MREALVEVAAFLRYGRLGASSRVRGYQFFEPLRALGCHVTGAPLLDNHYLRKKYRTSRTSWLAVARSYGRRLSELVSAHRYDVAFVEKELFPSLPAAAEMRFLRRGPPVVLDYDDAIWEHYEGSKLLREKIGQLMRAAAAVTVGSRHLESYAKQFNERVVHVPSVVDAKRYLPRSTYATDVTDGVVTIGWIGTPMTQALLEPALDGLAMLARERRVRLVLVGATPETAVTGIETTVVKWRESEEAERVRAFDVGIMPVTDTPFHRGKCGYKLVQYMAAGIPTVASPVGANGEVVREGETGFLVATKEEWFERLRALVDAPELRERLGKAGRRLVEEELSVERVAPRLAQVLRAAARAR